MTGLIVVDAQKLFATMVGDTHPAITNVRRVASAWRAARGSHTILFPFVGWKDESEVPQNLRERLPHLAKLLQGGCAEADFIDDLLNKEERRTRTVRKIAFDATRNSALIPRLRAQGVTDAVVCGLTTPVCVAETINGLVHEGFRVKLISDACASQPFPPYTAEEAHDHAVTRLRALWCEVTTTEALLGTL